MMGFRDKSSAGRSVIVPFVPGESHEERHYRRLNENMNAQVYVEQVLRTAGFSLKINNDGHHWILMRGSERWEWWPSTAKLIHNKNWRGGIHCHDYQQLLKLCGVQR